MLKQTIDKILYACKGKVLQKGMQDWIQNISIDSRKISPNSLFIPIIGEKFDGHDFIIEAKQMGAVAILCQRGKNIPINDLEDTYIIEVENTLTALQNISKKYRQCFNIPFLAVTGSTGKTSTKDMISSVLNYKFNTLKNIGNLNNEIGLPLTILNLNNKHEIAVLEMGMSAIGEILDLTKIVKPHIAIITNIGVSHISQLGNKENIAKAKMEIATYLGEKDFLLLNGEDKFLSKLRDTKTKYNKVFFGLNSNNDIYPKQIKDLGEGGFSITIEKDGQEHLFRIKQPGIHNVYNVLPAIWIGLHNGMKPDEIKTALENHLPTEMRMEMINLDNIKLINDAYNASPDSMKAALDVLKSIKGARKIAVLGNMFELGNFSYEGHYMVGNYAADKVDVLITVGDIAEAIADGATSFGMKNQIYKTMSNREASEILIGLLRKDDLVLIKGSRGMTMEKIVDYLQERS